MSRAAGALLHPSCLPGRFGIGDLGPAVEHFLTWAERAGFRLWQVLPLGPTTLDGSPYSALSIFAGNPLLLSPERLAEEGLLDAEDLDPEDVDRAPRFPAGRVDFEAVAAWKEGLLRRAWERFRASEERIASLEAFRGHPDRAFWLEDWCLFAALKVRHGGRAWTAWPAPLASREPAALEAARAELTDEVSFHAFVQLVFASQWSRVREAAKRRNIEIFGDLPIYPAHDSAEVWARAELFQLDVAGRPLAVAGVPPDAFSDSGQLWGNPLWDWQRLAADGYRLWVERLRAALAQVDRLRLDHFRGFAAYWSVSPDAETAAEGAWQPGPSWDLFDALRRGLRGGALGDRLIAEDLGAITPDVETLRRVLELPGMRVLQFAFAHDDSSHLPHHHERESAVYTGTHDNDTARGWWLSASEETRERLRTYAGDPGDSPYALLTRLAYTSVADLCVVPVQDVLGLGSAARMNVPGTPTGNWSWRLEEGQLDDEAAARLRRLAEVAGRL